ncbi:MAG TPA: GGDEF domain-containing protein [Acidobacteriota bacterium]|nr:GGDEF domain-containing protein [Acidobacteriota bacterium]
MGEATIFENMVMDALTGLPMPQDLPQILSQITHDHALSQLIGVVFDIDGFIWVNACFGPDVGDATLVCFSQWLLECAQSLQVHLIRIGGDEFLMLFPNQSLEEVSIIAQNLVQECQTQHIQYFRPDYPRKFLTISACVLALPSNFPENLNDLRECTAQALYEKEVQVGCDYGLTVTLA